jgi:hypothetical protein
MKTVKVLLGDNVLKMNAAGESGTPGVTPDISNCISGFKRRKSAWRAGLRDAGVVSKTANVKILTSCPSCL